MKTERINKVKDILKALRTDNFDSQGYKMKDTPEKIYQSLERFLFGITEKCFDEFELYDFERLPEGHVFISLSDEINKATFGIVLGENFANFFYTYHWEDVCTVEANSVEILLSNVDFNKSVDKFMNDLNIQKKIEEILKPKWKVTSA
jgi:hypothetical protein